MTGADPWRLKTPATLRIRGGTAIRFITWASQAKPACEFIPPSAEGFLDLSFLRLQAASRRSAASRSENL
jgi:hypothetical protein